MKHLFLVAILALFAGCQSEEFAQATTDKYWADKSLDRVGVLVACTKVNPAAYGGWNGACPGTDVDVNNVAKKLTARGIPYTLLFNERATANNVIQSAVNASKSLKDGGLLILYYSGHGGQLANSAESDGLDETICLYDGQMRDDVVWSLLTKIDPSRGIRVFMVTDCCNSGSNYRMPRNFATALKPKVYTARGTARTVIPNLCHWGGCGDGESSYGSSVGGAFTLSWMKVVDKGYTYRETQDFIRGNVTSQRPTFATLGQFDLNREVFK